MAASPPADTVQVVITDLDAQCQKLLREKLTESFQVLSQRTQVKRQLLFTGNRERLTAPRVLRLNPAADALLTGFAFDGARPDGLKPGATPGGGLDPQLRFPTIAELHKLLDQGEFEHRKLILVGDLYRQVERFLRAELPVRLTVFTDAARQEVSQPIPVTSAEALVPATEGEISEDRPLPSGAVNTVEVAGIAFHGVINMTEEGGSYTLPDATLLDSVRKLYTSRNTLRQRQRRQQREDRLAYVRGRKVFVVLEPDVEHVVADRLHFDGMTNVWRHRNMEEARQSLETGHSRLIAEHLEAEGYEAVFQALGQDERDRLLVAVLGPQVQQYLGQELEGLQRTLPAVSADDAARLAGVLPDDLLSDALERVRTKSHGRFMALVPPGLRQGAVQRLLENSGRARALWEGLGADQQRQMLEGQGVLLLAALALQDPRTLERHFPDVVAQLRRAGSLPADMPQEAGAAREAWDGLVSALEKAGAPRNAGANLPADAVSSAVLTLLERHAGAFYARLHPLQRRELWSRLVGEDARRLLTVLSHEDKAEVARAGKDDVLGALFAETAFQERVRSGEDPVLTGHVFLMLKRANPGESRTGLLRKVLGEESWRERRMEAVPAWLTHPDNADVLAKLQEHAGSLEFRFDGLICTRRDLEALQAHPPLQNAVVTLVDELVDTSLFDLFARSDLNQEDYDQFSQSVEDKIADYRQKLEAREMEDPVGAYLLETMYMLHGMTNQCATGRLDAQALQKLDERKAIRQRMAHSLRGHMQRIDAYLEKARAQLEKMDAAVSQARQAAQQAQAEHDAELKRAQEHLQRLQQSQGEYDRLQQEKRRVAMTQKELSQQFFEIIEPLIKERLRHIGSPLRSLLRMVGFGGGAAVQAGERQRVIFRFSDAEIQQILRYRIVFCSKDPVLMQFVRTCLRIDNLEDSLFVLATAEDLPDPGQVDLLFYGPGYSVEDFSDQVREHRMVAFADESFYQRLLENERRKAATKQGLNKVEREQAELRGRLDKCNRGIAALQEKRRQAERRASQLGGDRERLQHTIGEQEQRRHHYEGELELLESRLSEIDERFDGIKEQLSALLEAQEASAVEMLTSSEREMAARLQEELLAMNRELSRLMVIKGVKDAGDTILQNTQNGILQRLQQRDVFRVRRLPLRGLVVADDSTSTGQNMKRVWVQAAVRHFRMRPDAVRDLSIARLVDTAEQGTLEEAPLAMIFADHPADDYGDLVGQVRKLRRALPDTHLQVMTPYGELNGAPQDSRLYRNVVALRDQCAVVNASLGNYATAQAMEQLLQETAPTPRGQPAAARGQSRSA